MSPKLLDVLAVALGGGLGASGRYLLGRAVQAAGRWSLPVGTLTVNVLGCLLFGLLFALLAERDAPARLQLFLCTGVLGGFTTFSAFSHETLALLKGHQAGLAMGNAVLSVGLCLLATWAGAWLGVHVSAQR